MPHASRPVRSPTKVASVIGTALVATLALVTTPSWATVRCSDEPVQTAFHKALDDLYAPSRRLARVDVEVNDTIAVYELDSKALCKAAVSISAEYLGQHRHEDMLVEYVAEQSVKGNIFVTIHE